MRVFNLTKECYEYVGVEASKQLFLSTGDTFFSQAEKEYFVITDMHHSVELDRRGLVKYLYNVERKPEANAAVVEVAFAPYTGKTYMYWCSKKIFDDNDFNIGSIIDIVDASGHRAPVKIRNISKYRKEYGERPTKVIKLWGHRPTTPKIEYYCAKVRFAESGGEYSYRISKDVYENLLPLIGTAQYNKYDYWLEPNHVRVQILSVSKADEKTANQMFRKNITIIKKQADVENCTAETKLTIINKYIYGEKENKTMNNFSKMIGNFKFGKVDSYKIKFSLTGIAFRDASGAYCTYDIDKNELVNVSNFTFDESMLYQMPVAIDAVKKGDVITTKDHLGYVVVKEVTEEGTFKCVMPATGVVTEILPEKNIFGFNFVTKVINPFGEMIKPSADNPFGDMSSIMPLMMLMGDEKSGDNDFFKTMLMMNMMGGKTNEINPMMMMLAMRD